MRQFAIAPALLSFGCASPAAEQARTLAQRLQAIESATGGRLGVALADSSGRILAGHRMSERFAFCSTFKLLFGTALESTERQTLGDWLIASETGLERIRAGLPEDYVAGDKTGTCGARGRESYNDVAFIVPKASAGGQGYVLAVYLERPTSTDVANRSIAEVGAEAARLIDR